MLKTEVPATKAAGKMELMGVISELMPAGNPKFLEVINYPKITDLIEKIGHGITHKIVFLLIKDFCNTFNVVRNMNEDQMIEAAGMLVDECDNMRMEDYTMMFALAKRGGLIKIYDRIDLEVITDVFNAYWIKRHNAAIEANDRDINRQESQLPMMRLSKPDDFDKVASLGSAIADMKNHLK